MGFFVCGIFCKFRCLQGDDMKKLLLIILMGLLYAQCNPLEVAMFISEKDGWQFPYSAFYWGSNDATQEIMMTNPECHELLLNNEECIIYTFQDTPPIRKKSAFK